MVGSPRSFRGKNNEEEDLRQMPSLEGLFNIISDSDFVQTRSEKTCLSQRMVQRVCGETEACPGKLLLPRALSQPARGARVFQSRFSVTWSGVVGENRLLTPVEGPVGVRGEERGQQSVATTP